MKKLVTCMNCDKKPIKYPFVHFCSRSCAAVYGERCAGTFEWCQKHGWFDGSGCGTCMVDRLNTKGEL